MFSKTFKRCLASLCFSVILAGVLAPATAYANVAYGGDTPVYTDTKSDMEAVTNSTIDDADVDPNYKYTVSVNGKTILTIKPKGSIDEYIENQLIPYFEHISDKLGIEAGAEQTALEAYVKHYESNSTSVGGSNPITDLPIWFAVTLSALYNKDMIKDGEEGTASIVASLNTMFDSIHSYYNSIIQIDGCEALKLEGDQNNLGILNYIRNDDLNGNLCAQRALVAAAECLYIYQAIPEMLKNTASDNEEYGNLLHVAYTMADTFAYPLKLNYTVTLISEIYEAPISAFNLQSLEYKYEEYTKLKGSLEEPSSTEGWVRYESDYKVGESPLDKFYTLNVPDSKAVFTSYNRDKILNDVPVDDNLDNLLAVEWNKWKKLDKRYDFDEYWSSVLASSKEKYGINNVDMTDIVGVLSKYQSFPNEVPSLTTSNYGTDLSGSQAVSARAVTLSEYILDGMGYSTTYVPMKTNLYSIDVLADYSDGFLENFFYKYGFNRKALYIDTSASSVMDYYVSNGRSTPTVRIATLRDLLESGDSDVTLYIDSGFYNGADAKDLGTDYLANRYTYLLNFRNLLAEYIEAEDALNLTGLESFTYSTARAIISLLAKIGLADDEDVDDYDTVDELKEQWEDEIYPAYRKAFTDSFHVDITAYDDPEEVLKSLNSYLSTNNQTIVDDAYLKDNDYSTNYRSGIRAALSSLDVSDYRDIYHLDIEQSAQDSKRNWITSFMVGVQNKMAALDKDYLTENNFDAVAMDSYGIGQYMSHNAVSSESVETENGNERNYVNSLEIYNPMQGFAFVSLLYRDQNLHGLSTVVESAQPVFMASDDLCGVEEAGQWYRNSLLNYALVRNLSSMVQIDYNYACDIDAPIYMDTFGNILTESGTVVIPAASNATLHTGAYKYSNLAVGLYSCYGKEYSVPIELPGAYSVLAPYFTPDFNTESYVISNLELNLNGEKIKLNHINQYSQETSNIVQTVYKQAIREGNITNYNWMAMVHIINEVLRGAPVEYIDKGEENIVVATGATKSTIIAAIKLEGLIDSLKGKMSNTLMCIPDFTRNDNTEYWVALLIKIMLVAVTGVIIVAIYRDGVAGQLGLHTFITCISSVILTFLCITIIPAIFQLTYYSANKFLLEKEAFRILMVNTEKINLGTEIAMSGTREPSSSDDFSLQLDWLSVPWYEEINEIMFESGLSKVQEAKLEAYRSSPTYYNNDITMYNDGVYIDAQTLFNSVKIDYADNGTNQGLYLYSDNNSDQTASFYSPYYAFLRVLVANINEYNKGRNYVNETGATYVGDSDYTFTTKYMAGNKLKTVGLCEAYFTSEDFMVKDTDIMRLYQIYGSTSDDNSIPKDRHSQLDQHYNRALLFNDEHLKQFQSSLWYNDLGDAQNLDDRVAIIDQYARDFIAKNKDMLARISDETFIKVMSLYMAVKYNQLFGITHANALEIYNLDSNDLLRLCLSTDEQAALTSPMSYSRYICTFGGEASVYAAAVLHIIMYIGSFIKPLCTVIVYVSVFLSIFVFKVVLRKPSTNLWGYFITCVLLCATNFLHALILKISVNLPATGLSMLGCLIFMIVGQVCYLLVLGYVTGVACKDWTNLGANEYAKEAASLRSKFGKNDTRDMLNGRIKHHEDNWEYYNDLVRQHRSRNKA